jgi:hypothetical protein
MRWLQNRCLNVGTDFYLGEIMERPILECGSPESDGQRTLVNVHLSPAMRAFKAISNTD